MAIPVPTETVTIPDIVGVTVKVYPVELVCVKPLGVPLVTSTSLPLNHSSASEVVAATMIDPVIVPVAVEERVIPGAVASSIPLEVIPDAVI